MKKIDLVDFEPCKPGIWNWVKRWLSGQPHFVIFTKDEATGFMVPQLLRWWVLPRNLLPWNAYLHVIIGSDDIRHLHDHPWNSVSFLLKGGLSERRLDGIQSNGFMEVTVRQIPRLWPVFRKAEEAHALFLPNPHEAAVTLFLMGRKKREWGFYDANQGYKWVPWTEFVDARNPGKPK